MPFSWFINTLKKGRQTCGWMFGDQMLDLSQKALQPITSKAFLWAERMKKVISIKFPRINWIYLFIPGEKHYEIWNLKLLLHCNIVFQGYKLKSSSHTPPRPGNWLRDPWRAFVFIPSVRPSTPPHPPTGNIPRSTTQLHSNLKAN